MLRKRLLGGVVAVSSLLVSVSQVSAYVCEQPRTLTPTGYVSYSVNGGAVTTTNVTSGVFSFNNKNGNIDDGGYVTHSDINNGNRSCIFDIPGVSITGWKIDGQTAVTATPGSFKPTITASAVNDADGAGQNLTVKFEFTASNVSRLSYNCGSGGAGDISKFNTHWPGRDKSQWLKKAAIGAGSFLDGASITDWNGTFYAAPQMSDLAATMPAGTYTCTLTGVSPDGTSATSNSFSFTVVKTNADYQIAQFQNGIGVVLPNGVSGVTTIGTTGANTTFQSRDFKIPSDNEILAAINSITTQQSARNYVLNNHLTIGKIKDVANQAGTRSKYTGAQIESFIGSFSRPTLSISRSDNFGGSSGRKLWGMTVTANDAIRLDWDCSYVFDGDGKTYPAFISTGSGYTTNSLILPPAEAAPLSDISLMIPQASIYLSGKYTCSYKATGPDGQITTQSDTFVIPRNTSNSGAVSTSQTSGGLQTLCSNQYWFDNTSRACGQKQFCGTYMYAGLQTFSTQSACASAASAVVPTPEPGCSNLYWFDNTSKACGQKQFCGTYMYGGLQTFSTQGQCLSAVAGSSVDDEDTTVVDQSCTDLSYYMSISLTRSPSATLYTRAQSTDANTGGEVSELQAFLKDAGYMDASTVTTGRFGSLTTRAVKSFQARHGFTQTGATGPLTRLKIKSLTCDTSLSQTPATSPIALSSSVPKVLGASTSCADIPYNMHRGAESSNVKNLQNFLSLKGFYISDITGFYGDSTVAAVKDYQASKNLPVTGMVYDATRAAIHLDGCK